MKGIEAVVKIFIRNMRGSCSWKCSNVVINNKINQKTDKTAQYAYERAHIIDYIYK